MLDPTICPQCFQPNEPERTLCWKCMRSMADPATEMEYVRIFELTGSWTKDDLKSSFRKLARKYHPDANPGDREADSYFKFVNQAYEVISRRANEIVRDKAERKTPPTQSSTPKAEKRSDMASEELDQKLRDVISWSEYQKDAGKVVKKSTLQKIAQSINNLFKGKS